MGVFDGGCVVEDGAAAPDEKASDRQSRSIGSWSTCIRSTISVIEAVVVPRAGVVASLVGPLVTAEESKSRPSGAGSGLGREEVRRCFLRRSRSSSSGEERQSLEEQEEEDSVNHPS